MAAIETRRYIAQSQNYSLCPLSEKQISKADLAELLAPVFRGEERLSQVVAPDQNSPVSAAAAEPEREAEFIAEGFTPRDGESHAGRRGLSASNAATRMASLCEKRP
jgi:hypothetical protein